MVGIGPWSRLCFISVGEPTPSTGLKSLTRYDRKVITKLRSPLLWRQTFLWIL